MDTGQYEQTITANQFEHWANNNGDSKGTPFETNVFYNNLDSGERQITFKNLKIDGDVKLFQSETIHIVLSNCKISHFYIENVLNFRSLTVTDFSQIDSIAISKKGPHLFTILNNSKINRILFENCSNALPFIINNSKVGIIVSNKSNFENFEISNSNDVGEINFALTVVNDFFKIINSRIEKIVIKDGKIPDIFFDEIESDEIRLNNYTIESFVYVKSKCKELVFTYVNLRRIEILKKSIVGRLRIRLPLETSAQISCKASDFDEIDLSSTVISEFTTVQILNCKVSQIKLIDFCNYGTILLNNIFPKVEEESKIYMVDSDLGKIQIIKSDLSFYRKFVYSNTKMLELFIAGSEMPRNNTFCLPNENNNLLEVSVQKRLAYSQFKKIYENQGDIPGSLRYLAYEMDAYLAMLNCHYYDLTKDKNSLPLSKKINSRIFKHKYRGERWMLLLNKYSTNYGNDWLLGAKRTFWAVVICYSLFCLFQGIMFNFEFNSINNVIEFFRIVSYAPYYLNPLRDLDSVSPVDENTINPLARIWDFISRIIVAYFAYQTIQAFRKLGKSSG
ncbi:MAG: hypothetical protein J0M29_18735 [Chitinophagales bacterium]|nr:hypothetical protein [Chitinophagales bacterium]